MKSRIALIGFGEAASTFAHAAGWERAASAFDIVAEKQADMTDANVRIGEDPASALRDADIVLSLVTADQSFKAAAACAPFLRKDAIWCDMNSVAPQTKAETAKIIELSAGRYVDAAILAPVNPARLAVPVLLSGPAASDCRSHLIAARFVNVKVVGRDVGRASAIKMIRSIMVKGIEALTDEMMAAATVAGVTDEVLASLDASEKHDQWSERSAYNLERMSTHGLRRAAEMEEVAKTIAGLGLDPVMTNGTIVRQRNAGQGHLVQGEDRAA